MTTNNKPDSSKNDSMKKPNPNPQNQADRNQQGRSPSADPKATQANSEFARKGNSSVDASTKRPADSDRDDHRDASRDRAFQPKWGGDQTRDDEGHLDDREVEDGRISTQENQEDRSLQQKDRSLDKSGMTRGNRKPSAPEQEQRR